MSTEQVVGFSREEFNDLARRLKHAESVIGVLQGHLIDLYCRLG